MKKLMCMLVGMAMSVSLAGCAGQEDDLHYDETLANLSFTGFWLYDAGTTCTVGGTTMHCCPDGMAMIGAHIINNVFKCAQLTGTASIRFRDTSTVRNSMHACPSGSIMVGLHVGLNQLACQFPSPGPTFEFTDGNPPLNDGYPMHICPSSYAMAGIHVNNNLFTCDF
jgi:hypothetical protein